MRTRGWEYKKQGLTPEGAAIAVVLVTYLSWGAASGLGAAAGRAAAVSAGEGVALAGGGAFMTATGAAVSSVVGGAVTAGITTLASQAAVALVDNQGNLGHALHDLGSSQNVKGLLAAIATGGMQIWDGAKMEWISKKSNSTFVPPSWSETRIAYEVTEAFKKGASGKKFIESTPSGIQIQFFWDPKDQRTTFYPLGDLK